MSTSENEEELRLARKAWPDKGKLRIAHMGPISRVYQVGWAQDFLLLEAPAARLHAALRALAGEPAHVAQVIELAERTGGALLGKKEPG